MTSAPGELVEIEIERLDTLRLNVA